MEIKTDISVKASAACRIIRNKEPTRGQFKDPFSFKKWVQIKKEGCTAAANTERDVKNTWRYIISLYMYILNGFYIWILNHSLSRNEIIGAGLHLKNWPNEQKVNSKVT